MKAVPDTTTLPLYDEENIAQLQRFFGLELASKLVVNNDGDASQGRCNVRAADRTVTYFQPLKQRSSHEATAAGESNGVGRAGEAPRPVLAVDSPDRYLVRNKFWYCLFAFGATLGDDLFYFFIFSFAFANMSWWVVRRLLLVWGFCMFIGQASKEILQWPRPREPPVVRLEKRYFKEYGMPSTHAMVGTLIPFTLLLSSWNHYEYPHLLGFVLACNWTLLVCCSRLYRGMHYILDLVAGVTLTSLLMGLLWPWLDTLDHFQLTHPYAPIIIISVTILLIVLYPTRDGISESRGDTISILGTVAGASCAFWFNNRIGIVPDVDGPLGGAITFPNASSLGVMLARHLIIKCLAVMQYFGTKFVVRRAIYAVFGISVNEVTKKRLAIQLLHVYIPHCLTMTVMYHVGPLLFTLFNLN